MILYFVTLIIFPKSKLREKFDTEIQSYLQDLTSNQLRKQ